MSRRSNLNLIFDADDTLWDSNIHFRDVEREFADALVEVGIDAGPATVRASVQRFELEVISSHGYGRRPFVIALQRTLEVLASLADAERLRPVVATIGERFVNRNCELLPGVRETLETLATRHRLLLFTKGRPDEQHAKLDGSGLRPLFNRVDVPAEKNPQAYQALMTEAGLPADLTYMIGNSPRSDINPALKAGLGAVYIPHSHLWDLEHEEIEAVDGRLIQLDNFPQLLQVF